MNSATLFEEHSAVLAHWFANDACGATVICLDARLDLRFIDPERIARLAACTSAAALSALERLHWLSPDRSACYGSADFLYPAAQLGLLRRVVWVAPPHALEGGIAAALHSLIQMEGVAIEDLESFHVVAGGAIEGRLLGVELAICVLEQLPALSLHGPLLVDIDAGYFVAAPADTVWSEPADVVAALKKVVGDDAGVTIARSVASGFMPLRYRFIADYLAALWQEHDADAHHWKRLLELDRQGAAAGFAKLMAAWPDCAPSTYALALATPEPAARAALLAQAAHLDPAYGDDLLRRLGAYRARPISLDLARLMALQRELDDAGLTGQRLAIASIALGRLFSANDSLAEAVACDALALRAGGSHPALAFDIAKLHMGRGQFAAAVPYLERAAADDETRVGAWLHMAECAHAAGEHAGAFDTAMLACRVAPAWPLVPQRMAAFADARGNAAQARSLLAQHAALERRIARLADRLA